MVHTVAAGLLAALVLALTGCASGAGSSARGQVGETFAVNGKGERVRVLNPGSVSVSTNGTMPTLRVEAFRSGGERKP